MDGPPDSKMCCFRSTVDKSASLSSDAFLAAQDTHFLHSLDREMLWSRDMAKKKAKSLIQKTIEPDDPVQADAPPARITRHVRPMGPRVLVRVIKAADRLESGLYLPEGAKEEASEALLAEVLEVARAMPDKIVYYDDDQDHAHDSFAGENVSGIPINSKVLFEKSRGVTVPWDESLRLLHVRHILAIVDEIPEDRLQ